MSTTITTRQTAGTGATVKGAPLTNAEVDANFINLNTAVLPVGGIAGQVLSKVNGTDFSTQWIDNYATQVKLQVKNSTGATINKGSVVYISGATGANALISLAKADSDATSATTIGILESTLTTGSSGLVVTTGTITGLDTSTATEGDPVWLSGTTAGGVIYGIANKPQAPIHIVYLGTVTRSHATVGEIQVMVNNGWEMEELHDVQIISKANNDIIQYNSAAGVWKNVTPATARTNLGLAIGTNVQAWDGDLDAIAALAGTSGFLKKTAANTWSLDTNTYLTTAVTSVGGTGTVSGLTLTGTVTTTGNLTLGGTLAVTASNFSSQTANTFLAAPNGAAGVPTFRALVAADVPTLNQNTTGSSGSCTGNAATATIAYGLNVHTGRNNEPNKVVRTDGNGFLQTGYINSSSGDENNASSPNRVWGTNGSDSYLRTYQTSALSVGTATVANALNTANSYQVNFLGVGVAPSSLRKLSVQGSNGANAFGSYNTTTGNTANILIDDTLNTAGAGGALLLSSFGGQVVAGIKSGTLNASGYGVGDLYLMLRRSTADTSLQTVFQASVDGLFYSVSAGTGNTLYPAYSCRAWVSGVGNGSTIYGTGNVSSLTDTGVGEMDVNFANAMPDTNYAITATLGDSDNYATYTTRTTAKVHIREWSSPGSTEDTASMSVAIFR